MEVDGDDGEPGARVCLWIPSIVELVRHRTLRTAVNDERDRIFVAFDVTDWLDDIALYGGVVGALERVELEIAHLRIGEALGIGLHDARRLAAGSARFEQIRGRR